MGFAELFLLAVGLSMDAFAVSICKGLCMPKATPKACMTCGAWFGGFQALMPLIGFLLGSAFEKYITPIDHWVAFILLGLIGANMIKEANKQIVSNILDTLGAREAEILKMRFGINADKAMTLEEVGDHYGLSKERIRQLENKAIRKLRNPVRAKMLKEAMA